MLLIAAGAVALAIAAQTPGPAADLALFESVYLTSERAFSSEARAAAGVRLETLKADPPSDPAQMHLALAEITALADNAGSLIIHDFSAPLRARLPLRSAWVGDGLVVVRAAAPHDDLAGARILQIDGRPTEQLFEGLARYVGCLPARKRALAPGFYIEVPELLHAAGLAERPDRLSLRLQRRDGTVVERTIEARSDPALRIPWMPERLSPEGIDPVWTHAVDPTATPLWLRDYETWIRSARVDDLRAAYLQIKWTPDAGAVEDVSAAMEALRGLPPDDALVIDLRLDHGASTPETTAALRSMAAGHSGPVYVLLGPPTHAGGVASAVAIEQATGGRALLVGEPPGERLRFWGSAGRTCFPFAQVCAVHGGRRFDLVDGCEGPECAEGFGGYRVASLDIDLPAPMTVRAYLAGEDPALAAVRAHRNRSAPAV